MRLLIFMYLSIFSYTNVFSSEVLSIISPHRKSIQREFIPVFEKYYKKKFGKEIRVEWLDQGGTENDLRYIFSKFKSNPKTAKIDIFWGGGDVTYHDLDKENLLQSFELSDIENNLLEKEVLGLPLVSQRKTWYATAISSFGIFYNKKLLKFLKLSEPKTWSDLSQPKYFSHISIADPRHSSSTLIMNIIMLYSSPWDEAWKTLSLLSANTRKFAHSSSDPIKAVVSGDASIATAIDFYAYAKIHSLGKEALGFSLPEGKTIFNSDPIAILKGAPNLVQAQRFISYVLGKNAQKLFVLPKKHDLGPRWSSLGRMAVSPLAYENCDAKTTCSPNPFEIKKPQFKLSVEEIVNVKQIVADLVGAVYIDLHGELKLAWQNILKNGQDQKLIDLLTKAPLSKKELKEYSKKWDEQSFRNKTILRWNREAKLRYEKINSSFSNS